jgi:arsenate reductase (thioredoxin)
MLIRSLIVLLLATGFTIQAQPSAADDAEIDPELRKYVLSRVEEFDDIPDERRRDLDMLARFVKSHIDAGMPVRLNFICTHNSRRSQMCQIWARAAANHYGVGGVETYSGGTQATALNVRAVAALQRTGILIQKLDETDNPRYAVRFHRAGDQLICFSKVYDQPPNPSTDFCAIMTCSDADENCPLVKGSSLRVSIPYDDPRKADGTRQETGAYDERCRQVSREMLYLFSQL